MSLHRRSLTRFLLVALAAGALAPAAAAGQGDDRRTVDVNGTRVEFAMADLVAAEAAIRAADRADLPAVLAAMDPKIRDLALWDMSHVSDGGTTTSVTEVAPVRPPCNGADCEGGVGADPEPPVDPPTSVPTQVPPPVPPTCYIKEDVRRLQTGLIIRGTAFRFHQTAEFCANGQVMEPYRVVYSFYSDVESLWECQPDQENVNISTSLSPTHFKAHSTGHCWWSARFKAGNFEFDAEAGHARPFIGNTYDVHGNRTLRTGSAR